MEERAATTKPKVLISLCLGLITLAIYLPSVHHDFLRYDDQQYVTENPHVKTGLTYKNLAWAFGFYASNWHPLTWMSHMLDCQLYGLNPAGHHLTNALLHAATTVLLFLVLCRMTGGASVRASHRPADIESPSAALEDARPDNFGQGIALWPSAIVAGLFGWHPLHVESVAWVAERKDVLSGFFWMGAMWAYVRYVEGTGQVESPKSQSPSLWYGIALLLFAFGLMSKPMVVTLPFALLLLDFWPLARIFRAARGASSTTFQLILEKLPFFMLSAVACWLTIKAQKQADAVVSIAGLPIPTRIEHALISYVHYLGAMFWPRHLAVYYPYETKVSLVQILGAVIVLAVISLFAIKYAKRLPYLLVGWLWYLGMLVPVIGLVQVGEQAWADRYMYLPSIGIIVVVVWGISDAFRNLRALAALNGAVRTPRPTFTAVVGRSIPTAPYVIAAFACCVLLALTTNQLRYWKNTRTLFEHTAQVTRKNHMAVTLLGSLDAKEGKLDEAIERYKTALRWKPAYPEAHFFLANALDQQGKLDEAIAEYEKALWFKPMQVQTHIFLGAALTKKRKDNEAISHYLAALKQNPESAVAHNNLAKLLQTEGKSDDAIEHYAAALKFDPELAQAHNNLGVLLLARGRIAEGVAKLREASKLRPGDLETEYNLGLALNQQQQWSEAAELFGKLLEKKGNDANAHYQLGFALVHLQRTREAMSHYANALLIQPDFPDALDGLSWILATSSNQAFRNGTEAVRMAERACDLTGRKDAQKLKTLAAAYAEVDRFNDAVSTIQSAIFVVSGSGNDSPINAQQMLESFRARQQWRDPGIK